MHLLGQKYDGRLDWPAKEGRAPQAPAAVSVAWFPITCVPRSTAAARRAHIKTATRRGVVAPWCLRSARAYEPPWQPPAERHGRRSGGRIAMRPHAATAAGEAEAGSSRRTTNECHGTCFVGRRGARASRARLHADHGQGLRDDRVHFAGHHAAARLHRGQRQLAQASPGPRAEPADIRTDLEQADRQRIEAAVRLRPPPKPAPLSPLPGEAGLLLARREPPRRAAS